MQRVAVVDSVSRVQINCFGTSALPIAVDLEPYSVFSASDHSPAEDNLGRGIRFGNGGYLLLVAKARMCNANAEKENNS